MKKYTILSLFLLVGLLSFSQTKKELEDAIARKNASIDSLNKVIANMENIIENRDRSIKILNEDVITLKEDWQEENQGRRKAEGEVNKLLKQSATGTAKIMYMSNVKNILKVPEGKYWVMHQFMSDFSGGMSTDSTGITTVDEVHVFLKEINGTVLTDPSKNLYGPKLFSSLHPEQMIICPLLFTEGTQFKIEVYKGKIGALSLYEGKVYCTYTEKDN